MNNKIKILYWAIFTTTTTPNYMKSELVLTFPMWQIKFASTVQIQCCMTSRFFSNFVLFSFSWGKFRICGSPCERPELVSLPLIMVHGRVQVRLTEDDHANVCVQVNFAGFRTCKPVENETINIHGQWMKTKHSKV